MKLDSDTAITEAGFCTHGCVHVLIKKKKVLTRSVHATQKVLLSSKKLIFK